MFVPLFTPMWLPQSFVVTSIFSEVWQLGGLECPSVAFVLTANTTGLSSFQGLG